MMKYMGVVRDTAGNSVSSATVNVYIAGGVVAASIYSDNSYTVLANPLTTGADGSFQFYAANGRYDITISKTGISFPAAESTDTLVLDVSSVLTPAQLTSNTDNYAPANGLNASIWRISSNAGIAITGITAGKDGQIISLVNVGVQTITLNNQDANSSAANRIITGTGGNVAIAADVTKTLVYDLTTARWRILS